MRIVKKQIKLYNQILTSHVRIVQSHDVSLKMSYVDIKGITWRSEARPHHLEIEPEAQT